MRLVYLRMSPCCCPVVETPPPQAGPPLSSWASQVALTRWCGFLAELSKLAKQLRDEQTTSGACGGLHISQMRRKLERGFVWWDLMGVSTPKADPSLLQP